MDVSRTPNSRNSARQRYEQARQDAAADSQERVRGAREALHRLSEMRAERLRRGREAASDALSQAARKAPESADSVQISDRARILANEETRIDQDDARAERVAELKARFEKGELNSRESAERAAANLLRGEDA